MAAINQQFTEEWCQWYTINFTYISIGYIVIVGVDTGEQRDTTCSLGSHLQPKYAEGRGLGMTSQTTCSVSLFWSVHTCNDYITNADICEADFSYH